MPGHFSGILNWFLADDGVCLAIFRPLCRRFVAVSCLSDGTIFTRHAKHELSPHQKYSPARRYRKSVPTSITPKSVAQSHFERAAHRLVPRKRLPHFERSFFKLLQPLFVIMLDDEKFKSSKEQLPYIRDSIDSLLVDTDRLINNYFRFFRRHSSDK